MKRPSLRSGPWVSHSHLRVMPECAANLSASSRLAGSAANLQGARVDDVGGCAADVVHQVVEGGTKVQFVTVELYIADVGGTDAIFQPKQGMSLQDGLAFEHVHGGHAGAAPVQRCDQGIGLQQFGA